MIKTEEWKILLLLKIREEKCSECRALREWLFLEKEVYQGLFYYKCKKCSIKQSILDSVKDYGHDCLDNDDEAHYFPRWNHYVKENDDSIKVMSLELPLKSIGGIQRFRFTGKDCENMMYNLDYSVPNIIRVGKKNFYEILKSHMINPR